MGSRDRRAGTASRRWAPETRAPASRCPASRRRAASRRSGMTLRETMTDAPACGKIISQQSKFNSSRAQLFLITCVCIYLEATSSGVSSISSTQLTESCFSTTPLTAGRGGESGAGEDAGEGGESGSGDAERPESPDDVLARIGGLSM